MTKRQPGLPKSYPAFLDKLKEQIRAAERAGVFAVEEQQELTDGYPAFLGELEERIRLSRLKAVVAVNREMLLLFWSIGRDILVKQRWQAKDVERLARDLRSAFPEMRAFTRIHLGYMKRLAEAYPDERIFYGATGSLPWDYHRVLLDKAKSRKEREWYIQQTIECGWGLNVLVNQIESRLYERIGTARRQVRPGKSREGAAAMPIDQYQLTRLSATFDSYKFTFGGVEAWSARDLQQLLGYSLWQNFRHAIKRAMDSCRTAGRDPTRHFVPVTGKLRLSKDRVFSGVFIGVNKNLKGTKGGRLREDMILSRFGAYLVAMNGDPSKEEIAFAQAYFIVQTRKTEVLEERLAEMERLAAREQLTRIESAIGYILLAHGVPRPGFAYIRSLGDEALFGGFTTKDMKKRLGCPPNTPLADYLQTVSIKAKELTASMTAHNVQAKNMWGT
ncbi:MAG: DUF1016 N-terminal domain-containing protein, partial [Hyphomicrobiaceae bacterium]